MPDKLSHEEIARQAKELYESELRAILEPTHLNEFVTIEPVSRTYYLGKTFSEAVQKAKQSCPGFLSFTLRVGHRAALHLGGTTR